MFFDQLELHWWEVLIMPGLLTMTPLFRAVAVVIVGRCVSADIAKLAIPLILRPIRPSIFPRREAKKELTVGTTKD